MRRNEFNYWRLIVGVTVILGFSSCGNSKKDYEDNQNSVAFAEDSYSDEETVEYGYDDGEPSAWSKESESAAETSDAAARRYKAKYEEVNIADIHLMRADGKKIWYNPWTHETESGYVNKLYVYDSETDCETVVNLNKTSMEDSEMWVEDMVERNGVITVIMSERRNSNGWVEGTYVWQYDCYGNSWKAIARGCSGAEFVNNRTAVRINDAEILNPDDPTYLQKYGNHYRTVRL